jgi:aminoglycoside phosphotransferase (APT) family kinase protein
MEKAAPATLLDHDRLVGWLDAQGLEPGAPLSSEPITGGASNVMFRLERGGARWVLRRPALVALERADEGMRREFRILTALEGTPVPHPAPVALCDDHDVLGCTFYLMGAVDGVSPLPPPPSFDGPSGRAELTFALTDALALLHQVDPVAAGIADLGRPDGFHERQVTRWTRQLQSYEGRELPGFDRVAAWLEANRPGAFEPSIMHGDYHMYNVLVAPEPPARVVAILDWETATIGDPLLDLAGFCEIWTSTTASLAAGEGWPTRDEIVARYAATRGLGSVGDLTYYEVLYQFRFAVLLEGIYQRSLRDPSRPDQGMVGERVIAGMARAVELIDGSAAGTGARG